MGKAEPTRRHAQAGGVKALDAALGWNKIGHRAPRRGVAFPFNLCRQCAWTIAGAKVLPPFAAYKTVTKPIQSAACREGVYNYMNIKHNFSIHQVD